MVCAEGQHQVWNTDSLLLSVPSHEDKLDLDEQLPFQRDIAHDRLSGSYPTMHRILPNLHSEHRDLYDFWSADQLHEVLHSLLSLQCLPYSPHHLVLPHPHLSAHHLQQEARLHEGYRKNQRGRG